MDKTKNEIELKLLKDADIIVRVEKREPLVICGVKYVPEGVNSMTDIKNQPHYTQFKIQPVVFIAENNIPYLEGNIIKYVCRYNMKNGIEDLKKAQHYLEMLINKIEGNDVFGRGEVKQEDKPMTFKEVLGHAQKPLPIDKVVDLKEKYEDVYKDLTAKIESQQEICSVCLGSGKMEYPYGSKGLCTKCNATGFIWRNKQ